MLTYYAVHWFKFDVKIIYTNIISIPLFISYFSARSPVFSHLSASLQGLHTIRALRVQKRFIKEFDTHQDLHSEAWFLFISTTGWFASKLDWICAIFVTVVAFSSVISVKGEQ